MTEQDGQLIVRRKLLVTLQRRELSQVGQRLQKELGIEYQPTAASKNLNGKITKSLKLASGRFSVVQKSKAFSLVPWRQVKRMAK